MAHHGLAMDQVRAVVRFILRSGKRIAVTVVGFALLAGGLVMMVTPGPGILVIIAGLAVLATEYAWARRTLERTKEKAKQGGQAIRGWFRRRRS
jgi:uncharacterized protein (TIGR02611 family)